MEISVLIFFFLSTIKKLFLRKENWRSGCSEERWAIHILLGKTGLILHSKD